MSSIKKSFKNMFDFQGRASRTEYWSFFFFVFFVYVVSYAIEETGLLLYVPSVLKLVMSLAIMVFVLILLITSFSLSVRRFHDMNRKGWIPYIRNILVLLLIAESIILNVVFYFLSAEESMAFSMSYSLSPIVMYSSLVISFATPVLGLIELIMCLFKGTEGENKYGSDPLASLENSESLLENQSEIKETVKD